jgi:hypothetical protein
MPKPAEIDPLVFELDDRGDLGESIDPFDEGVFDDLAEAPRKTEKLLRCQVLLAKENHEVVEPSAPDRRDGFAVEFFGEIDPAISASSAPAIGRISSGLRIIGSNFPCDLRPTRRGLYRNYVRPLAGQLAAQCFDDLFGQPIQTIWLL